MRVKIKPNATDEDKKAAAERLYEKKPHLRPRKADDGRRFGQWTKGIVNYAETRAGRRMAAAVARGKK